MTDIAPLININAPKNPAPWPDPTPEMLADPRFEAIWQIIKSWDINVPTVYSGYCGATGNHVRAILDAISRLSAPFPEEIAGLIAMLEERAHNRAGGNSLLSHTDYMEWKAAAALRSLAQEAERLKGIESDYLRRHKDACDRWERIRELEAERAAIQDKTIGECADAVMRCTNIPVNYAYRAAKAIHTLATAPVREDAAET